MRDHQMHGLILMNSGVRNKSASPILTRFIPKWEMGNGKWEMGDLTLNIFSKYFLTLNIFSEYLLNIRP